MDDVVHKVFTSGAGAGGVVSGSVAGMGDDDVGAPRLLDCVCGTMVD